MGLEKREWPDVEGTETPLSRRLPNNSNNRRIENHSNERQI